MTWCKVCIIALFLPLVSAAVNILKVKSSLHVNETVNSRPIRKVIELLKDMSNQLQKEADADEDLYDKMACWCETNKKRLTKEIHDSGNTVDDLKDEILQLAAQIGELTEQIKQLEKEVEKYQEALDQATELRRQQSEGYIAEEKDLIQSIGALRAAVIVLSKHHTGSFLQMSRDSISKVAVTIQRVMQKHASLLKGVLKASDKRLVASLVSYAGALVQLGGKATPPTLQAKSGEIYGILTQMLETFEADLKAAQRDEAENLQAYNDLKEAKESQIAAAQKSIAEKKAQLADAKDRLVECETNEPETATSMATAIALLEVIKERCDIVDKEWEVRQETRNKEIKAVSDALAKLTSDEAHAQFSRTYNFLQVDRAAHKKVRAQASKLLLVVAKKVNDPKLAILANSTRLDSLARVKEDIDKMIAALVQEQKDENTNRADCVSLLQDNEAAIAAKEHRKETLQDELETMQFNLKELTATIDAAEEEIKNLQAQLQTAGEERQKEKAEFEQTLLDHQATQRLLTEALTILNEFYMKDSCPSACHESTCHAGGSHNGGLQLVDGVCTMYCSHSHGGVRYCGTGPEYEDGAHVDCTKCGLQASLLQQQPVGIPDDFGFHVYKKQTEKTFNYSVLDMIKQIISDSEQMVRDAEREEESAKTAYEEFTKTTNADILAKSEQMNTDLGERGEKEVAIQQKQRTIDGNNLEIEQLSNGKVQLHSQCDFILNNFDIRLAARDEEVEALKQAKAILSGARY